MLRLQAKRRARAGEDGIGLRRLSWLRCKALLEVFLCVPSFAEIPGRESNPLEEAPTRTGCQQQPSQALSVQADAVVKKEFKRCRAQDLTRLI